MDQEKKELTGQQLMALNGSMLNIMEAGDRTQISYALSLYKTNNGQVDHVKTLSIPSYNRIPELLRNEKDGRARMSAVISASITSAMQGLNVRLPLNDDQVFDLSEMIIDSAHEDYLSVEDVILFLRDLVMGKVAVVNDRMDVPTFFKLFEVYRQDRHEVFIRMKEEQHSTYKSLGRSESDSRMGRGMDAQTFIQLYGDLRAPEKEND